MTQMIIFVTSFRFLFLGYWLLRVSSRVLNIIKLPRELALSWGSGNMVWFSLGFKTFQSAHRRRGEPQSHLEFPDPNGSRILRLGLTVQVYLVIQHQLPFSPFRVGGQGWLLVLSDTRESPQPKFASDRLSVESNFWSLLTLRAVLDFPTTPQVWSYGLGWSCTLCTSRNRGVSSRPLAR